MTTNGRWVFSGFYPFQSRELPDELSRLHNQPLFNIGENVVGIMLPYPHGCDDDPILSRQHYNRYFMHIFNLGTDRQDSLVGVARCVKYETGPLPPNKRVTFALET